MTKVNLVLHWNCTFHAVVTQFRGNDALSVSSSWEREITLVLSSRVDLVKEIGYMEVKKAKRRW